MSPVCSCCWSKKSPSSARSLSRLQCVSSVALAVHLAQHWSLIKGKHGGKEREKKSDFQNSLFVCVFIKFYLSCLCCVMYFAYISPLKASWKPLWCFPQSIVLSTSRFVTWSDCSSASCHVSAQLHTLRGFFLFLLYERFRMLRAGSFTGVWLNRTFSWVANKFLLWSVVWFRSPHPFFLIEFM